MKNLILALALLLPALVHAQCKYKEQKLDEFTKAVVKETEMAYFVNEPMLDSRKGFSFRRVGDEYFINMSMMLSKDQQMNIVQGGELMLKLTNDSIVTGKAIANYNSSTKVRTESAVTTVTATFRTNFDGMVLLSNYGVTKYRFYFSDGYHSEDVKEKPQGKLMPSAKCVLAE